MTQFALRPLSWVTLAMTLISFATEGTVVVKRTSGEQQKAAAVLAIIIVFLLYAFFLVGIVESLKPTTLGSALSLIIVGIATVGAVMGIVDVVNMNKTPKQLQPLDAAVAQVQAAPQQVWDEVKNAPQQVWDGVKNTTETAVKDVKSLF